MGVKCRIAGLAWMGFCACAHGWSSIGPLPSPAEYPGESAVVLLEQHDVQYHLEAGRPVADARVRRAILALRPNAPLPAEAVVRYSRGFSEVLSLRARLVLPDGTSKNVEEPTVDQPVLSNAVLYQDNRTVRLPLPPVPAGGVLDIEYVVRSLEPGLLPQTCPLASTWRTRRAVIAATAPVDWRVQWSAKEMGEPLALEPTVTRGAAVASYSWEAADLPPFIEEPHGLSFSEAARTVALRLVEWREGGSSHLSPQSPAELSDWVLRLSTNELKPSEPMRHWVEQVVAEEHGAPERIAARLYDFAADQIQYCAIELGMAVFRPHAANEVYDLRYGDSKDKANLFSQMLGIAQIPAERVMIYTHRGFPRRFDLTELTANFNHEVVSVSLPGGKMLADPTDTTAAFGEIPFGDAEAPILRIGPTGQQVERAPSLPADANVTDIRVELRASNSGLPQGDFRVLLSGAAAGALRHKLRAAEPKKWPTILQESMPLVGAQLDNPEVDPKGKGPLSVKGTLTLPAFNLAGNTLLLKPSQAFASALPRLAPTPRHGPWFQPYRETQRLEVHLALPPNAALGGLPATTSLDGEFGRYRLAWRSTSAELIVMREVVLKEHVVPADRYEAFKRFCDQAHAAEAVAAVVHIP
jgi:transglutaminase-like putative cysteine protease